MRLYFGLAVSSSYQATTANELKALYFQYGCFLAKYFCEYLLLFFFNKPVYSCKDTTGKSGDEDSRNSTASRKKKENLLNLHYSLNCRQ